MSDPFDLASRRTYLQAAMEGVERLAFELIRKTEADIRSRGWASVGCHHPTVDNVFRLIDEVVDKALEFDERATQFRLQQVRLDGKCDNPFDEASERQLIEFVGWKIQSLPSWIRTSASGGVVWAARDQQHEAHLCAAHRDRLTQRIQSEYAKRRAEFDLTCKSQIASDGVLAGQAGSGTPTLADDVWLSPADAQKQFPHLSVNAVGKKLGRWRQKHDDGWREATERRPREAQYLYRWGAVRNLFESASGTAGERRAK